MRPFRVFRTPGPIPLVCGQHSYAALSARSEAACLTARLHACRHGRMSRRYRRVSVGTAACLSARPHVRWYRRVSATATRGSNEAVPSEAALLIVFWHAPRLSAAIRGRAQTTASSAASTMTVDFIEANGKTVYSFTKANPRLGAGLGFRLERLAPGPRL